MGNMFNNEGSFTPDSLIASADFSILKEGIGLKAGKGVLERGSLIVKNSDGTGIIASADAADAKVFGILADKIDTGSDSGDNIPAVCYITGVFNPDAIITKDASTAPVNNYEDALKGIGIYLRGVQKY